MESLTYALVLILTLTSIFNFFTIRSVRQGEQEVEDSVAILIPMRNEVENVSSVVSSALSQVRVKHLKVIAIDDDSTDGTRDRLEDIRDGRFAFKVGTDLPEGWLGKNFALENLSKDLSEDFIVFLDADVRLAANAVADSINLMKQLKWDYISPYPRQLANNLLARIVQPLLQWSWFSSLPLRLIEGSKSPSTVVANGQFFIVRNSVYRNIGGHSAIKSEVLDDIELARELRRAGAKGSVVDGSSIATCEMYRSTAELISGYSKSQWRAFGNSLGAILACALLFISSISPLLYGLNGKTWGWIACISLVLSRFLAAIKTRSILSTALLHQIAILIWIGLICRSLVLKRTGSLQWRGRNI